MAGAVGALLPATPVQAETTPPAGTATLAPAPAATAAGEAGATVADPSIIGAAAASSAVGDTSIRPFKFHASDDELADLKRRIQATKWPERENDPTQGVNLATIKPTVNGWDPQRIARAWAVLMNRLGYTRYVAQGGDWGNAVTEQMALQQPPGLVAIHTNMPA
jgi:hypothetical protein